MRIFFIRTLVFGFALFANFSFSQSQNSLLWEISQKGNPKKSYIYGTMHVNDKISYHLSDDFYEALKNVEAVANESDPQTWSDLYEVFNDDQTYNSYKFYTEFYLLQTKKRELLGLFSTDTNYFKNMLSGNNSVNSDYQEDTVLDMFIFQTGKKLGKKIVGLEDPITSYVPIFKLNEENAKPSEESKSNLVKMLKNKSFDEAIKDYYREKNFQLLDSVYKMIMSPKAHDALIVSRNIDMANSMDSIMKGNSLFAAVGAAHLGGKKGMLKILEEKGYTVKPVISSLTDKGKNLKKEFEDNFPKPTLHQHTTKDGFISFKANPSIYLDNNNLSSPDYANGANIKISRLFLNNFLQEKDLITEHSIDSLFFENIPGNTLKKDFIETPAYKSYSISNVTKTGNHQHYNFYITPLEAISISLVGPKNYVELYEKDYLQSIQLKTISNKWVNFAPETNTFNVSIPEYYVLHTNDNYKNVNVQAYNSEEESYYFVIEKTLSDKDYLEDTQYEMQQIQREFLLQYKTEPNFTENSAKKVESKSELKNGKTIYLSTIVSGSKYYLLGCVNAPSTSKDKFFNSFSVETPKYSSEFKTYTDNENNISVKIPFQENKKYFYNLYKSDDSESKNQFKEENDRYAFVSETGKTVALDYTKYHKYESIESVDTLRNRFKKYVTREYSSLLYGGYDSDDEEYDYATAYEDYDYGYGRSSGSSILGNLKMKKGFKPSTWKKELFNFDENKKLNYEILEEKETYEKDKNQYRFSYLLGKPNNSQAIRTEILANDSEYIFASALVDKNNPKKDEFITTTFNSINLSNSDKASVYTDKWQSFVDDAFSSNDSIRYSALNSLNFLDIADKDVPEVIKFIERFNFKVNENEAKNDLIDKLAEKSHPDIIPFFDSYYRNNSTTNETKLAILKSLALQKSKKAYDKIFELMEFDLPVTNHDYEITSLFYNFNKDLENSKTLFPRIFEFYSVAEYNEPITRFSANIVDKYPKEYKKLKPYRKMMLTNAKLELKRIINWKEQDLAEKEDEDEEYEDYTYVPDSSLMPYLSLLFPEENQSNVATFFNQVKASGITSLQVELMRLKAVNNKLTNNDEKAFLNNPKTAFLLMLLKNETYNKSEEEIAELALINFYNRNVNDSISLMETKIAEKNNKKVKFFFYNITEKEPKNYETSFCGVAFVCKENGDINPYAYNFFSKQTYTDESELNDEFEKIINANLNIDKPRASFENINKDTQIPQYYDLYDDY